MRERVHRIYDNIYGYIDFNRAEFDYDSILRHPFFLRLLDVRQMGMVNNVFPGATHSRYAHSLGVYAIVNKMMSGQERLYGDEYFPMNDKDKLTIRLAALLHDIGHVPLSHTVEHALTNYRAFETSTGKDKKASSQDLVQNRDGKTVEGARSRKQGRVGGGTKLHELLGEVVVTQTDLRDIIERRNLSLDVYSIAGIFKGERANDVSDATYMSHGRNFIHSQLDADRLDYLLRDSSFTGVMSGAIDFDKLMTELRYTEAGTYGVTSEGLRVLEQFFMARFAAYSQIPFNRKVHSYEYTASQLYYRLLVERNNNKALADAELVYDYKEIANMIAKKPDKFLAFTDRFFFRSVERIACGDVKIADEVAVLLAKALFKSSPLKVVCHRQRYVHHTDEDQSNTTPMLLDSVRGIIDDIAKEARVDVKRILIPERPLEVSVVKRDVDPVYVFDNYPPDDTSFTNVAESPQSFLRLLSDSYLRVERIFTFDEADQKRLKEVMIKRDLIDETGQFIEQPSA